MNDARLADPERQLALAYAPAGRRAALSLLWHVDERMGAIVAATREPMIGAMRLIWWRDALIALGEPDARVPAEPLLVQIAGLSDIHGCPPGDWAAIEEGWAALLEGDVPDEAAIRLHGQARGGRLFALGAALLGGGGDHVAQAGEGWALADLSHHLRDRDARMFARTLAADRLAPVAPRNWPAALRPLGLLTILARRDAAMTADAKRRQGSPGRLARAMAYGLFGR